MHKYPTPEEFKTEMDRQNPRELGSRDEDAWQSISSRIEAGYNLSQKQINYWWSLAGRRAGRPQMNSTPRHYESYPNLVAFLARASLTLQQPSLRIGPLLIRKNSQMYSKYPDDYGIKWDGMYSGSLLSRNGAYYPAKTIDNQFRDKIRDKLKMIDADPMKAIAEEDAMNCCFCGRELDNEHSRAAHYGPTCAEHYNLPWGD